MQLSQQKCRRHAQREAAALCPECKNFFCRECVTEHDGRLICSDCILKLTATAQKSSPFWVWVFRGGWGFLSFILVWVFFYSLGQFLLDLPSTFHEGTYWTESILKGAEK